VFNDYEGDRERVDPRVIEIVEGLARGNMARLQRRLPLHDTLFYDCMKGGVVHQCVAETFEEAVSNWIYSPNFDAPPFPPPKGRKELARWIKDYVGSLDWVTRQLCLEPSDKKNAFDGRSMRRLAEYHAFAQRFYEARAFMDVRNEAYEAQTLAWRCGVREIEPSEWQMAPWPARVSPL
jgi:hypothetical protein